ncbi:DUF3808 domain-containing protein [Marinigracilibium pacificum]|uniref:DUF3808 domain-containing protein n=1 Tax=Marinigracilibium pacificum TaxID=2729599 RepID=A0A848IXR7_9BACT|nr:DUF3808 domain-containing protein [Marinigracilibium pacificum]NMM47968.1 DUF3808 domain-containing protein [Marinigracilibium pacificum]
MMNLNSSLIKLKNRKEEQLQKERQLSNRLDLFFILRHNIKQAGPFLVCLFFLLLTPCLSAQSFDDFFNLDINQESQYKNLYSRGIKVLLKYDEESANSLLDDLEEFSENNTTDKYLECRSHLLLAVINARYENNFAAFKNFRKAFFIYREYGSSNNKYDLAGGLMHITISSVPEKFVWLTDLLGLKGNKETGLTLLNNATKRSDFVGQEARLLYPLIANYLLNDQEIAKNLTEDYSLTTELEKIVFIICNAKARGGQNILNNLTKFTSTTKRLFPASNYLIGETFLRQGKYGTAREYLMKYKNELQSDEYLSACDLNIFLSYYLNGDYQKANTFKSNLEKFSKKTEADRYASKALNNYSFPPGNNELIWKLRLATDGGFDDLSGQIINTEPKFNLRSQTTEWNYRKARYYHSTNHIDKAQKAYNITIDLQQNNSWYYAPNSCIKLATILINNKKYHEAKAYLVKAKSYKGNPYEESINYEASILERQINDLINDL